MADRALRADEPEREIVELDKDERWQARLAEARVRREIALREKANGDAPPKPRRKPWEDEGLSDEEFVKPIEPILQESDDDKLDFYDRVKTIRETTDRRGDNSPPPGWVEYGDDATSVEPKADAEKASVADRYISALAPDFEPVKPYVPVAERSYSPAPAPVVVTASDVGSQEIAPEVAAAAQASEEVGRSRRRGVPLMLLAGVCVLALLPFTTEAPPVQKGPSPGSASLFGLQPALGITRPMNEVPRTTVSGEWMKIAQDRPAAPLAVSRDVAAQRASEVAPLPESPATEPAFGTLPWAPLSPALGRHGTSTLAVPISDNAPVAAQAVPAPTDEAAVAPLPAPLSDLRVTILVPATANQDFASEIASDVLARGHELNAIKPVDIKITERNVRYFHSRDRGEAERLADAYDARLKDFTSFRPAPADGTVEVWLVGEGTSSPVVKRPVRQARPEPEVPPAPTPRVIIVQRTPTFMDRLSEAIGGGHVRNGGPPPSVDGNSGASSPVAAAPKTSGGTGTSTGGTGTTTGGTGTTTGGTGTATGGTGTTTGGTGTTTGGTGTTTGGTGTTTGGTGTTTGGTGTTTGGTGTTTGGNGTTTGGTGTTTGGTGTTSGGTGTTSGGTGTTTGGTGTTTGGTGTTTGGTGTTTGG